MKDQYFGDINDFFKYALLYDLSGGGVLRTGICWMLTGADGRTDGSGLGYLGQPLLFRDLAPDLFDFLQQTVIRDRDRRVACLEAVSLLPNVIYHSPIVPDDKEGRAQYFRSAATVLESADWIFFDPDNGLEVPSVRMGKRGSSKYLYWKEVVDTYRAGKSVFIYQHFPRKDRAQYVAALAGSLKTMTGAPAVIAFRTSRVVFLLAPQPVHAADYQARARLVASKWSIRMIVTTHDQPEPV